MRKTTLPHLTCQAGFTLAELLVVLALMALLTAIALPTFTSLLDTTRLSKAAAALKADIRRAQERAQREGRPVRLRFDTATNTYQIQLANSATTPADCTDPGYTVVQTVNLQQTFQVVYGPQMTWPCLVFAATGRTAWKNPTVLTDPANTTTPYLAAATWNRFFNGAFASGKAANVDPEVAYWLNKGDTLQVTADLGLPRYLESACPDLIEDLDGANVPLPDTVQLQWSSDGATWLPASPPTATGPFETIKQEILDPYGNGTGIYQACPALPIGQNVRYLRFTFALSPNSDGNYIMALDEIKLPDPFVTLQNRSGRGAKTLTITPVTGKVSIQ